MRSEPRRDEALGDAAEDDEEHRGEAGQHDERRLGAVGGGRERVQAEDGHAAQHADLYVLCLPRRQPPSKKRL
jgi:hypothetical protein